MIEWRQDRFGGLEADYNDWLFLSISDICEGRWSAGIWIDTKNPSNSEFTTKQAAVEWCESEASRILTKALEKLND